LENIMVELTIDGQKILASEDATVMETALTHGIDIPHLCYHPELPISGNCRMCLVEVEKPLLLTPACSLLCEEGMEVHTQSDQLTTLRRDLLELYLADHPLNCLTCDKAGACDLQKYAYQYGVAQTGYHFSPSRTLYQDDNPFFIRDHQYCILCGKCVRVCNDVVGASAIKISGRGVESHIATPFDRSMLDSDCVFCGNCVQVCPTAALLPVSRRGQGREWDLQRTKTICGYCGVGCEIEYARKNGDIVYAQATKTPSVNGEMLCSKGRFGWDYAKHPERLTTPLMRKDVAYEIGLTDEPWHLSDTSPLKARHVKIEDSFVPVDWETAVSYSASQLAKTVREYGPDAVMGLASARCTNEENYVYQKFMRAGIGTNNLDHCARL
jgi:predicted molibdopterin-dependent oxidoreductase YjgC